MCANQPGASSLAEVLMMHGKRVVLLTAPPVAARPFAADIVIDICGCTDVSLLHRLYTPTVIVAGNNIAKARQLQMCRQAARLGIQMHITRLHGAYVF
jgi:hypothetical protein